MDPFPERPQPSRPVSAAIGAWLQWFGLVRLVVTACAVLAVGAGGYWLLRTPAAPVEQSLPVAGRAATTTVPTATLDNTRDGPPSSGGSGAGPIAASVGGPVTTTSLETTIVVQVAGAVLRPGVLRLVAGARVDDALAAAGGPAADADLDALNLATVLRDADRVYVPHIGQPIPSVVAPSGGASANGAASTTLPTGPLDLNRATAEQLDALPGVGPATAAAIVARREQYGPFSSVDGLLDVPGIGPAKLEAIRALVTV